MFHRLFLTLVWAAALSIGSPVGSVLAEQATKAVQTTALINARLVIRPGEVIERGMLLIRDDRIEAVAPRLKIPADAIVLDLGGRTVYPGFIDANSRYGQSDESPRSDDTVRSTADHENSLVSSARDIAASIQPNAERALALRELGITSVLSQPASGVFRGQAALLSTIDPSHPDDVLMVSRVAQALAFETNANGSERYPVSPAGSTALIRQVLLDAKWQQQQRRWLSRQSMAQREAISAGAPPALSALWPALSSDQPVIFQADVEIDLERAARLAQEFGLRWLINGNGYEYRQAPMLKASGAGVIVSLKRPPKPDVASFDSALDVTLSELEHWEWTPFDARVLAEAGVPFALTSAGLADPAGEFWPRLREAVGNGLAEEAALAALTLTPAAMLGVADRVGTLAPRRSADLVIADAELFRSSEARIHEVWTRGRRHVLPIKHTAGNTRDGMTVDAHSKPALPAALRYPVGEYGRDSLPPQPEDVVVRGATVWTQSAPGVMHDADLWVHRGRIRAVGKNLSVPRGAMSVDGRGLHVTPGLIDPHSHIALYRGRGYGEASHAVTSEVRSADVLNATDISIYRQLADGVTTVLLLQGSANPINGQSQLIKLRWGQNAEGLKFEDAPPSMKFALGESPMQANWGLGERHPRSRMGLQYSLREAFDAANDYKRRTEADAQRGMPVRRDLRQEAVLEVLSGKSIIHVHSYRQDELLAFMRLTREFGIVPVFHHVSEGYKVADEMAAMGAGASTFPDYWGFRYETADGIPYNMALMTRQGVTVSMGSDSSAGAPNLNIDAVKAVRYGGMSESEALQLVTLNPARQMRVQQRVGSLEPGKDADFVLWTDHPLSVRAKVLQTWIDGRRYFDAEKDRQEQTRIERERTRLIDKVRGAAAP